MLSEVEPIINNAPLAYVYPNTIKTCYPIICCLAELLYSSNITSTDKINCISKHFWGTYRHYIVNLRETQQTSKLNINSQEINVNDIDLVYDEMVPRHFWRTAIVTGVLLSRDSEIRGAIVRMAKANTTQMFRK